MNTRIILGQREGLASFLRSPQTLPIGPQSPLSFIPAAAVDDNKGQGAQKEDHDYSNEGAQGRSNASPRAPERGRGTGIFTRPVEIIVDHIGEVPDAPFGRIPTVGVGSYFQQDIERRQILVVVAPPEKIPFTSPG